MNARCLICGVLVLAAGGGGAAVGERLTMRVTPLISYAPTNVIVQTHIEPNEGNRSIEVVAESGDFYRSSELQLKGQESPQSARFEFRGLPGGEYTVAAVLRGSDGVVALKRQDIQVVASPLNR